MSKDLFMKKEKVELESHSERSRDLGNTRPSNPGQRRMQLALDPIAIGDSSLGIPYLDLKETH